MKTKTNSSKVSKEISVETSVISSSLNDNPFYQWYKTKARLQFIRQINLLSPGATQNSFWGAEIVFLISETECPVIHAGASLIFQKCLAAADMELQRSGHTNSFKPLPDQVSLHLNQKCQSTTKHLGKLQRNHKPSWKWRATSSLWPGRNQVLYCSLSKSVLSLELPGIWLWTGLKSVWNPQNEVKLIVFCGYFHFLLAEDTSPCFGRAAPALSRVSPCLFAKLWPSFGCPFPAGACRRTTGQTACRGLTCCAGLCTTVAKAS